MSIEIKYKKKELCQFHHCPKWSLKMLLFLWKILLKYLQWFVTFHGDGITLQLLSGCE